MTQMTDTARRNVLYHLAAAHDAWSEQEQRLVGEGRHTEAQGARIHAQWVIRAWLAESDDPEPEGLTCPS